MDSDACLRLQVSGVRTVPSTRLGIVFPSVMSAAVSQTRICLPVECTLVSPVSLNSDLA
jgi:hypothetical protein